MSTSNGAPRVAVIGAGMSGILSAIKLDELGIPFEIFEKAERIGGTWRENTYPGLSCDVPSHAYTYSFARNPDWSQWFAPAPRSRTTSRAWPTASTSPPGSVSATR